MGQNMLGLRPRLSDCWRECGQGLIPDGQVCSGAGSSVVSREVLLSGSATLASAGADSRTARPDSKSTVFRIAKERSRSTLTPKVNIAECSVQAISCEVRNWARARAASACAKRTEQSLTIAERITRLRPGSEGEFARFQNGRQQNQFQLWKKEKIMSCWEFPGTEGRK
jgi:hypothetical protein